MDKNMENNFSPYMNFDIGADPLLGENPMFNPIMQYEQKKDDKKRQTIC